MDKPNTTLDDISAEIGYSATNALVAWFGGDYLRVPATVSELGPIAAAIGVHPLRRLVAAWGGQRIWVPQAHRYSVESRDHAIAVLLVQGKTPGEIAGDIGLTRRRVEQVRETLTQNGMLEMVRKNRGQKPGAKTGGKNQAQKCPAKMPGKKR